MGNEEDGLLKSEIVLFSFGFLNEHYHSYGLEYRTNEIALALGIRIDTLKNYISQMRKEGLLEPPKNGKKLKTVNIIELSRKGYKQYQYVKEDMFNVTIDPERYNISKRVRLKYLFDKVRNPLQIIFLISLMKKYNSIDIPAYLKTASIEGKYSYELDILKELGLFENQTDMSLSKAFFDMTIFGGPQPIKNYHITEIEPKILYADIVRRQGKIKEANMRYLSIIEKLAIDDNQWFITRIGLAQCEKYLKGPEPALEMLDDIGSSTISKKKTAQLKRLKADILSDMGEFNKSRRLYSSAIGTFYNPISPVLLSVAFNNQGVLFFRWGKINLAKDSWLRSKNISIEYDMNWPYSLSIMNLSDIYATEGKFRSAKRMLNKAERFFEMIGDEEGLSGVNFNRSLVYITEGNRNKAMTFFQRAEDFPLMYKNKREERRSVLRVRFGEKGWLLPF